MAIYFSYLIYSKFRPKMYRMKALIDYFEQTIQLRGGTLVDEARRQRKGFLCAILPMTSYLQAGDLLTGGAALKIYENAVSLHTYLLRQICSNGMVQPMLQQERRFEIGELSSFQIEFRLGLDALHRRGLAQHVRRFEESMRQKLEDRELRRTISKAATILNRSHLREDLTARIAEEQRRAVNRGREDDLPRRFDLINAVTALARDTGNPMQRWKLMEFAGHLLREEKFSSAPSSISIPQRQRETS